MTVRSRDFESRVYAISPLGHWSHSTSKPHRIRFTGAAGLSTRVEPSDRVSRRLGCDLRTRKHAASAVSSQVPQTPKKDDDNDGRRPGFSVLSRADSDSEG